MRFFDLSNYAQVIRALEKGQSALVLVGGHAVNAYAEAYCSRIAELEQYLPFVSKDADLLGGVEDGMALASRLRLTWRKTPTKGGMRGLCLGSIALPFDPDAKVEVLGQINGAKSDEVRATATKLKVGEGVIPVINPFLLMEAKGANSVGIEQVRANGRRQDVRHFRMMSLIVTRMLADAAGDAANQLVATNLVKAANRLMNWWFHGDGLALVAAGASDPRAVLPLAAMREHPAESVRNVVLKRWPHFERQLADALPAVPARILAKLAADLADLREGLETTRRVREKAAAYLVSA